MAWRWAFVGFAAIVFLAVPSGSAHGDVLGVEEQVTLDPQEEFEFRRGLHYHRMVGEVSPRIGTSTLELVVMGPTGASERVLSTASASRVNHLILCCKSGNVWDEHVLLLRNVGEGSVSVDVRLTFLHDDFAVVVHDAEPGAWWQTLFFALVIPAIPAWKARARLTPDPAKARRWARLTMGSLAAAWTLAGLASLTGMVRFGGGPLEGFVTSHEPWPVAGLFLNSTLVTAIPLIGLYIFGLAGWAIARRITDMSQALRIRWLGCAYAAGPLLFGTFLMIEYGNPMLSLALALLPAGIILAGEFWPRRAAIS